MIMLTLDIGLGPSSWHSERRTLREVGFVDEAGRHLFPLASTMM